MKKIKLLLISCLIVSSNLVLGQSTNNIAYLNKMQKIALPYLNSKISTISIHGQLYGFYNGSNIMFKLYDNLNLSVFSEENKGTFIKNFNVTNGTYRLVEILIGESEWVTCILATIDENGNIISYIESVVCFGGDVYMKQYSISSDMQVKIYHYNILSSSNIDPFTFTSVYAQRIDCLYHINSSGQFIMLQQKKYLSKDYSKQYLQDSSINIWDGDEVLK